MANLRDFINGKSSSKNLRDLLNGTKEKTAEPSQPQEDKTNKKGSYVVNQKAPVASGYSVPERIWNFLTQDKGLGSVATAAIMGNIFQESTYNPSAINSSSGAKGICQWYQGRATKLDSVASGMGKQWSDLEAQLTHLWNEIGPGGYYNQFLNQLTKYTEAQLDEAVIYWEKHFEVSGDTASYPRRIAAAREALQKQGKGIIAAGNYNPAEAGASGGYVGQPSAAKRGAKADKHDTEDKGHTDEYTVKPIDPDKTFCEPIYPDLTTIGEEIPTYAIPPNIPTSDMKLVDYEKAGAGLVFSLSTESILKNSKNPDIVCFNQFNEALVQQRKTIFNAKQHRGAVKALSNGKPPNNNDPFPVDNKIEELEIHQPRCKIDSVEACKHSLPVAKKLVALSTDVEKRLVRIENNMATIMRYLYRMASRVHINCVYYGGQSTYEKYKCIRCLKDDLVYEGAEVSLDQCLNCTRYEPLIGQVYDIYNDAAIGLSQILDTQQTSLGTMEEYYKFVSATEKQQKMESAKDIKGADVTVRNQSESDFSTEWGPGLAMDWSLYPVEMQQPHVNWRQSINVVLESKLGSYYGLGANSGYAMTNGGVAANPLLEARKQIDQAGNSSEGNTEEATKKSFGLKAKNAGSSFGTASKAEDIAVEVKAKLGSDIREYYKSQNISSGQDTCLIASLLAVSGGSTVGPTIDKLEAVKKKLKDGGVDNIVLSVMFFFMDTKYLFGDNDKEKLPVRLDEVKMMVTTKTQESGGSSEDSSTLVDAMSKKWDSVNTWNWEDFAKALTINIEGDGSENTQAEPSDVSDKMVDFAKVVYLYKELLGKCSASRFDTAEWGFPFTEEEITGNYLLNFSSPFGPRNIPESHNTFHYGIDIGVGSGAASGNPGAIRGCPVHAARDGVVYDIATYADNDYGGQQVYIQHEGGYTTWYMHLSKFAVNKGDKVTRGQVIGYTGGSGPNHDPSFYAEHLHFEIHQGGDDKAHRTDPLQYYNGITVANKGSQLSAINA